MLKPAILFKDELEKLFSAEIYTDRYFYYVGYPYEFELPNISIRDGYYQWVMVDENDTILGYLAYHVDVYADSVDRFGWYSFSDGNQTVIRDCYEKLEELIREHNRVEWRVIEGNHAKRGYDNFCKKHNGNCVCFHSVTKDTKGNYLNEYVYEIVKEMNNDTDRVYEWEI